MNDQNKKKKIIESWIMVERLLEGEVDKKALYIKNIQDDNYYDLFMNELNKINNEKIKEENDKKGIVVFFDIFPFQEIIDILKENYKKKYGKEPKSNPNEKYDKEYKFSFVLCFDKNLKIDSNKIFFTQSYYIRKYKDIDVSRRYEESDYEEEFNFKDDKNKEEYKAHFNSAISSIIKDRKIDIQNCKMLAVKNLKDYVNFHSFFIDDLEYTKNLNDEVLNDYILGKEKERVNFITKTEVDDERPLNEQIFGDILQPKNYPIARFPSDTKHSLAFMQQVAVNLAIGADNQKVRSVNGPPGTGKTTLLRDIFAELVVRQAWEITKLSNKVLKGTVEYKAKASTKMIGMMPESIAEKGIVVASSNNGAVQNIVNELPLLEAIDDEFKKDLKEADYFIEIAISDCEKKWIENEDNEKIVEYYLIRNNNKSNYWGLFSLEGGKKECMDYIKDVICCVNKYLNDKEYKSNEKIYDEFHKEYKEVEKYRSDRQKIADNLKEMAKIKEMNKELLDIDKQILNKEKDKDKYKEQIKALRLQKPSWYIMIFSCLKRTKEYNFKLKEYSDAIQNLIQEKHDLENKKNAQCEKIQNRLKEIKFYKKDNKDKKEYDIKSYDDAKQALQILEEKINEDKMVLNINELDLSAEYKTLQLSNPWFNEEYRKLQSKLFVSALKVRKQFLYDNRENVNAACEIYIYSILNKNNKLALLQAWNWTNMIIPVISSTFASFSRMCSSMDEKDQKSQTIRKSIGHLFIDEAGQALPWASVGAIFRSRNIMAVGDPAQIKPVLKLNSAGLELIGDLYKVSSSSYLSEDISTQTLVDKISKYGFYKKDEEWIGIPLWVHRRCKSPMFDISNIISYDGNMVQGIKECDSKGKAEWFDISGVAIDKHVVKEQLEFLKTKIIEMPDDKKRNTYVITPFRKIANNLEKELSNIGFIRKDKKGKMINVGSVHTFQGKEADVVFLVLGADEKSEGAARWAMSSPNIMNVAATRAKKEFYIIGDKKLYEGLKKEVVDVTIHYCEKA